MIERGEGPKEKPVEPPKRPELDQIGEVIEQTLRELQGTETSASPAGRIEDTIGVAGVAAAKGKIEVAELDSPNLVAPSPEGTEGLKEAVNTPLFREEFTSVTLALLSWQRILRDIAKKEGQLKAQQLLEKGKVVQAIAELKVKMGEKAFEKALTNGIASIAAGVITIGSTLGSVAREKALEEKATEKFDQETARMEKNPEYNEGNARDKFVEFVEAEKALENPANLTPDELQKYQNDVNTLKPGMEDLKGLTGEDTMLVDQERIARAEELKRELSPEIKARGKPEFRQREIRKEWEGTQQYWQRISDGTSQVLQGIAKIIEGSLEKDLSILQSREELLRSLGNTIDHSSQTYKEVENEAKQQTDHILRMINENIRAQLPGFGGHGG